MAAIALPTVVTQKVNQPRNYLSFLHENLTGYDSHVGHSADQFSSIMKLWHNGGQCVPMSTLTKQSIF